MQKPGRNQHKIDRPIATNLLTHMRNAIFIQKIEREGTDLGLPARTRRRIARATTEIDVRAPLIAHKQPS